MEGTTIAAPSNQGTDMAEQMKRLAKLRMQRQVFKDPTVASELVKTQATATYNAEASLVQSAVSPRGSV
ncbi:hypothetical protein [Desulfovibrio oxyclinae]|uniref:hypothetical protein n=1 Tax=Desulfovibrio oxyclinae TaxID=63560 RepID=UPI000368445F|nr:hypothetical protein [Desulfovibrio oxyclinae]